jgi:hypothetical protein
MEQPERSRSSPAIHFLRPLFLIIVGLLVYGILQASLVATVIAVALLVPTAAVGIALHTSYRRRQEENAGIRCG